MDVGLFQQLLPQSCDYGAEPLLGCLHDPAGKSIPSNFKPKVMPILLLSVEEGNVINIFLVHGPCHTGGGSHRMLKHRLIWLRLDHIASSFLATSATLRCFHVDLHKFHGCRCIFDFCPQILFTGRKQSVSVNGADFVFICQRIQFLFSRKVDQRFLSGISFSRAFFGVRSSSASSVRSATVSASSS